MGRLLIVAGIILFSTAFTPSFAQKKRMPVGINIPNRWSICPTLSADGRYIMYLTNYSNDGTYMMMHAWKNGPETWEDAILLKDLLWVKNDHYGSYCLSHDGQQLWFSSRRANGIGGFDIWYCNRSGKGWGPPTNPGKPLNSPGADGNPSLDPNGRKLYFMRCDEMELSQKNGCKIYMAEKKGNSWTEPKPLPDYVNQGNCTSPRIAADGITLYYSSDMPGGVGKLDYYMTRFEYGTWSKPVNMEFINNEQNNEFGSVPAKGDIFYYTDKYDDDFNLYMAKIPDELQPVPVMLITGSVNIGNATQAMIQAFDAETGQLFVGQVVGTGTSEFFMTLPAGAVYDFSVFPKEGGIIYYSQLFDLSELESSDWSKPQITLEPVKAGAELNLQTIDFREYSSQLTPMSDLELKRLSGLMQKNPAIRLEIGAFIDEVIYDSIASNNLTEVIVDTVWATVDHYPEEMIVEVENLEEISEFSFEEGEDAADSLLEELNSDENSFGELIDENLYDYQSDIDSLVILGYRQFDQTDSTTTMMLLKYTYHNDRTLAMAEAIVDKLVSMGAPASRLTAVGYADEWEINRAPDTKDYWIRVKID